VLTYPARTTPATDANAERPFVQWGPSGRCGLPGLPVGSFQWKASISVLQLG
jgi:hypothetical protein